MLLIRQAAVYAPEYLGVRDVLVCGGVIEAVEEQIEGELPFCKVIDGRGKKLTPGLLIPMFTSPVRGRGQFSYSGCRQSSFQSCCRAV